MTLLKQVATGSMDSALRLATRVLVLLLMRGLFVSCHGHWCYDKPECGPQTWQSIGFCGGANQSPINIVTRSAKPNRQLGPIIFTKYDDKTLPHILSNDGHSADIKMKSGAAISGPGLPGTYHLQSLHFHWGTYRTHGSEHAINGQRYSMELHLVHTKNNMRMEEAVKDATGIAAVAFFLEMSRTGESESPVRVLKNRNGSEPDRNRTRFPNRVWKRLARLLPLIPEKGDKVRLNQTFSILDLLTAENLKNSYYRYRGSVTCPPCNEAALWTVYPKPIRMASSVMKKFTNSLYFTTKAEGRRMQNNFRPLQPLGDREVFYYRRH